MDFKKSILTLYLEDVNNDFMLLENTLKKHGLKNEISLVHASSDYFAVLNFSEFDLILSKL